MTSDGLAGRFVVVPAAYLVMLRPGRDGGAEEVLLTQRHHTGYMDGFWATGVAGHIERGETALDAIRREAVEEVGVTDIETEFVTAMQRTRHAEPIDERVDFFFLTRRWSGEPRRLEPHKSAALRWFPLDALPDPLVAPERWLLEMVLAHLQGGPPPPAFCHFGFHGQAASAP